MDKPVPYCPNCGKLMAYYGLLRDSQMERQPMPPERLKELMDTIHEFGNAKVYRCLEVSCAKGPLGLNSPGLTIFEHPIAIPAQKAVTVCECGALAFADPDWVFHCGKCGRKTGLRKTA